MLLAGSAELDDRSLRSYSAIGRLAPHAIRAVAQAERDRAMRRPAQLYPETNAKIHGEVLPFRKAPHCPQRLLASSLAIRQGIMFVLLLAVCGNAANLMLARTSTRIRPLARACT